MDVLALKAGHDGSIAYVRDGRLEFCHESEKDSFERHAEITPELLLSAMECVVIRALWIPLFRSQFDKRGFGPRRRTKGHEGRKARRRKDGGEVDGGKLPANERE